MSDHDVTATLATPTVPTTIAPCELSAVRGGQGAWSRIGEGITSAYDTARNFTNGFAAGATFGPNARAEHVARYGDRNASGFRPGVETGMMFNMALGPAGRAISAIANRVPGGGGGAP